MVDAGYISELNYSTIIFVPSVRNYLSSLWWIQLKPLRGQGGPVVDLTLATECFYVWERILSWVKVVYTIDNLKYNSHRSVTIFFLNYPETGKRHLFAVKEPQCFLLVVWSSDSVQV